jgi:hypothetical protein
MGADFYTRLFVKMATTHDILLQRVAAILNGQIDIWTVEADGLVADVRPNEDAEGDATDFIHYPYTVEVATQSLELEDYLSRVGAVMNALHAEGAAVVAACDWEDVLPGRGSLIS